MERAKSTVAWTAIFLTMVGLALVSAFGIS
jgi:hypothetical protein